MLTQAKIEKLDMAVLELAPTFPIGITPAEFARARRITESSARRTMHRLARAGLLVATRGPWATDGKTCLGYGVPRDRYATVQAMFGREGV